MASSLADVCVWGCAGGGGGGGGVGMRERARRRQRRHHHHPCAHLCTGYSRPRTGSTPSCCCWRTSAIKPAVPPKGNPLGTCSTTAARQSCSTGRGDAAIAIARCLLLLLLLRGASGSALDRNLNPPSRPPPGQLSIRKRAPSHFPPAHPVGDRHAGRTPTRAHVTVAPQARRRHLCLAGLCARQGRCSAASGTARRRRSARGGGLVLPARPRWRWSRRPSASGVAGRPWWGEQVCRRRMRGRAQGADGGRGAGARAHARLTNHSHVAAPPYTHTHTHRRGVRLPRTRDGQRARPQGADGRGRGRGVQPQQRRRRRVCRRRRALRVLPFARATPPLCLPRGPAGPPVQPFHPQRLPRGADVPAVPVLHGGAPQRDGRHPHPPAARARAGVGARHRRAARLARRAPRVPHQRPLHSGLLLRVCGLPHRNGQPPRLWLLAQAGRVRHPGSPHRGGPHGACRASRLRHMAGAQAAARSPTPARRLHTRPSRCTNRLRVRWPGRRRCDPVAAPAPAPRPPPASTETSAGGRRAARTSPPRGGSPGGASARR